MKREELKKIINIKSDHGFTMQDLVAAIIIFAIFTGVIATLMNTVYQLNYKIRMTASATNYAIQILEDIDKIAYEDVNSSLTNVYINQFQIPKGFDVKLDVTDITEETGKQDIVKKVKLTISYTLYNNTEDLIIQKYKLKEL